MVANGTGRQIGVNGVVSEPFDLPCHIWVKVSQIGFVHRVSLTDQFFNRAADLNYVPEDQRRCQQAKIPYAFLLLVRIVLLNHSFDTKLQPFCQCVVAFDAIGPSRYAASQRDIGDPPQRMDGPLDSAEFLRGLIQAVLAAVVAQFAQEDGEPVLKRPAANKPPASACGAWSCPFLHESLRYPHTLRFWV
jgi:hypothetical protein